GYDLWRGPAGRRNEHGGRPAGPLCGEDFGEMMAAAAEHVFSTPEELITEARAGRMFILTDAEDRENEGDLIIPAAHVTPAHIAFMAREGRGLVCLAMDGGLVDALGLPLMPGDTRFGTAFTLPIAAR